MGKYMFNLSGLDIWYSIMLLIIMSLCAVVVSNTNGCISKFNHAGGNCNWPTP